MTDIFLDDNTMNKIATEAKIYYHEGLYNKALDRMLYLINNNVFEPNIYRYISNIYFTFENYTKALEYCEDCIRLLGSNLEIIDIENKYKILDKLSDIKLFEQYLAQLNELARLNPSNTILSNLIIKTKLHLPTYSAEIMNNILDQKIDPEEKKSFLHIFLETNYLNKIMVWANLSNDSANDILSEPKKAFRYFCYNYISLFDGIKLPNINIGSDKEAVLIEFRTLPHLEFIIKNAILKLGSEWSHTIVCGELNYDWMKGLCQKINPNIKIIKLPYTNLNPEQYSGLLTSLDFWSLLSGEKILIYQEDTIIFNSNYSEYLKWDYIGAPWPPMFNNNSNHVGNGGFSLRTKQVMIDVINKKSQIPVHPEDIFFSRNIIEHNLGQVPDRFTAHTFSSEYTRYDKPLGGHCFFLYDKKWKELMYSNIIFNLIIDNNIRF